ncbi:MAG: Gfo/Idh/MocA family oxidoreductase [Clostridia bacterium]|nr:Gfo/Idh/MocA family oxidoreductase [Clostridia bacterium]
MEREFSFAIMGAGHIAVKFADAVRRTAGCRVSAVASKSMERARRFALENGVPDAYDSYEGMLDTARPDCVYIATTCDSHFALGMLCLERGVPVLCEKAMFTSGKEAEQFFRRAREAGVFAMEALWSLFLPANRRARDWAAEGRIGTLAYAEASLGFAASRDADNRYYSPALGGGAANDLSIYGLHLLPFATGRSIERASAESTAAFSGVDETNALLLRLAGDVPAVVRSSLGAPMEERMALFGSRGRIVVPHAHYASEAVLYDEHGAEIERFRDTATENGFTYEVEEVMCCVTSGALESPVVPQAATLEYTRLLDLVRNPAAQKISS